MTNRINIIVAERLLIAFDRVDPSLRALLRADFTRPNPVYYRSRSMGFWCGNIPREICTMRRDGPFLSFPRGALHAIENRMIDHGFEPVIVDHTIVNRADFEFAADHRLRPYQENVVNDVMSAGANCVFRGGCGSGKTNCAIGIIAALRQKTLVIVHSKLLMDQWALRISEWLGVIPGIIGSGKQNVSKSITIGMQQTLWRCIDKKPAWVKEFGLIVGDEIHHWGAKTFNAVTEMFPARYRIGASACEKRKDGLEFLIYDTFGPCVHTIDRDELVETNRLLDVELRIVITDYADPIYLDMIENGFKPDWVKMLNNITYDSDRNELIIDAVERVLVENESNKVLILTERVFACEDLKSRLEEQVATECGIMIGGVEHKKATQQAMSDLSAGKIRVVVGTNVADEGLDIPSLTHVFITCPIHSNPKRMEQMAGRTARVHPGKTSAVCVYFWDDKMFPARRDGTLSEKKRLGFLKKLNDAIPGSKLKIWNIETGLLVSVLDA